MTQDKRNIDKLFKENLKGLREKPPVGAWDRLDNDLRKKNSKKTLVYIRWMAASLLILLAFGSGYFYAKHKIINSDEIVVSDTVPNINSIDKPYSQKEDDSVNASKELPKDVNNPTTFIAEIENSTENIDIKSFGDDGLTNNEIKSIRDKKTENVVADAFMQEIDLADTEIANKDINENLNLQKDENPFDLKNQITEVTVNNTEIAKIEKKPVNTLYYNDYIDIPDKKQYLKWSVGAQFAPIISYRDISTSYNTGNTQGSDVEADFNNSEEPLLAFSGGIDVNYNVNKRWSIRSGFYISRVGQINSNALDFKEDKYQYILYSIGTSTGDIDVIFERVPENIRSQPITKDTVALADNMNVKITQNFDFIEIPFLIKYKILNRKFALNLSGGISPAYLVKNQTILELENNKYDIGSSSNLNSLIFNSAFALGIEYSLSKKLVISLEPTLKYSLNSLNKNSQLNYHPYSLSWFTGIRYKF